MFGFGKKKEVVKENVVKENADTKKKQWKVHFHIGTTRKEFSRHTYWIFDNRKEAEKVAKELFENMRFENIDNTYFRFNAELLPPEVKVFLVDVWTEVLE